MVDTSTSARGDDNPITQSNRDGQNGAELLSRQTGTARRCSSQLINAIELEKNGTNDLLLTKSKEMKCHLSSQTETVRLDKWLCEAFHSLKEVIKIN